MYRIYFTFHWILTFFIETDTKNRLRTTICGSTSNVPYGIWTYHTGRSSKQTIRAVIHVIADKRLTLSYPLETPTFYEEDSLQLGRYLAWVCQNVVLVLISIGLLVDIATYEQLAPSDGDASLRVESVVHRLERASTNFLVVLEEPEIIHRTRYNYHLMYSQSSILNVYFYYSA